MEKKLQMFWDEETKRKAEEDAKRLGLTVSSYVRYLINKTYEENRRGEK